MEKSEIPSASEFKQKITQVIDQELSPFDLKELLLEVRENDSEEFKKLFLLIPNEILGDTLSEFPDHIQEEVSNILGVKKKIASIATEMDSDDAAVLIKNISEIDEKKAEKILDRFEDEDREVLEKLISYDNDVVGAYMQTELFSAN